MSDLGWQVLAFALGAAWLAVMWVAAGAVGEYLNDVHARRQFRGPRIPQARPTVRRVPR